MSLKLVTATIPAPRHEDGGQVRHSAIKTADKKDGGQAIVKGE